MKASREAQIESSVETGRDATDSNLRWNLATRIAFRFAFYSGALDETLRRELHEISPDIPIKFSTMESVAFRIRGFSALFARYWWVHLQG